MDFMKKKGEVKGIVMAVIGLVIAVAMIPVIVSSVESVKPNLTGGALILVGLITLIFVAGIIVLVIRNMIK